MLCNGLFQSYIKKYLKKRLVAAAFVTGVLSKVRQKNKLVAFPKVGRGSLLKVLPRSGSLAKLTCLLAVISISNKREIMAPH